MRLRRCGGRQRPPASPASASTVAAKAGLRKAKRLLKLCSVGRHRVVAIGDRDVLLVERFDREKTEAGYRRARMVSALTLLKADDSPQSRDKWSYLLLAEELRRVSAEPKKDAAEMFQRMCFNALITNTDDHPRNHALIAKVRD
jgi:serine/threonine-protein kinase HipA